MKGTSWVHVLTSPPPLTQSWLLVFPDGPQHLGRSWEEADTPRHPLPAPAQVPLSFRDVLPKSRVLQDTLALVGVCPSPCLSRSPSPAALTVSRQLLPCLLNGSERLIRQGLLRVPTRGGRPQTWGPGCSCASSSAPLRGSQPIRSSRCPRPTQPERRAPRSQQGRQLVLAPAPAARPASRAQGTSRPDPAAEPGADARPLRPQSLLFLGLVAAVCLGLNLVFLAAYLACVCCCRPDSAGQTKRRDSCCVTWMAVVAGLVCW